MKITSASQLELGNYYLCGGKWVVQLVGTNGDRYLAKSWGLSEAEGCRDEGELYVMGFDPEQWVKSACIVSIPSEEQAKMLASIVGDPFW